MPVRSAKPGWLLMVGALIAAAALLLVWPAPVAGVAVHKCRDAAGQLSYQDEPCPPGTALVPPVLAPEPAYVPPTAAPTLASGVATTETAPTYPSPAPPLPHLYRCVRYDGQESYVTPDPVPRRYQVPLWTVLPDRMGLSGGGITTSAGVPAGNPARSLLGAYTMVEDRCHPMPRAELCGYWAGSVDDVRKQARLAFNDTRPRLEQEHAGLRENLAVHCGR